MMDLPAQQHHINSCLDRRPGTATSQHSTPRANQRQLSRKHVLKCWLEDQGLGLYTCKFEAVKGFLMRGPTEGHSYTSVLLGRGSLQKATFAIRL